MKTIKIIGLVLLVLAGLAIMDVWPATVRYRLTLNVEENGKIATGSGVIEGSYYKEAQWLPLPSQAEWHTQVTGEAVMVDLGERGILFALLKEGEDSRSSADYIALKAFGFMEGPIGYPVGKRLSWIADLGRRTGAKANIPFKNLPMLVRFKDINDPKTVERVDPNNLAASFGDGVKLVSASIEITFDPVTTGVEKKLGWLPSLKGYLDGQFAGGGPQLPNILDKSDLRR